MSWGSRRFESFRTVEHTLFTTAHDEIPVTFLYHCSMYMYTDHHHPYRYPCRGNNDGDGIFAADRLINPPHTEDPNDDHWGSARCLTKYAV